MPRSPIWWTRSTDTHDRRSEKRKFNTTSNSPKHLTIRSYFFFLTDHRSKSFVKRGSKFAHASRARTSKSCEWTMFNFSDTLLIASLFFLSRASFTHLTAYQKLIWRRDWILLHRRMPSQICLPRLHQRKYQATLHRH